MAICLYWLTRHHKYINLLSPKVFELNIHHLNILFVSLECPRISVGLPPYVIQEEFDRYDGFLWHNIRGKK